MLIRTLVGCYYNKITTVCAGRPTHIIIRTHTRARSRAHTLARTRTRTSNGHVVRTHIYAQKTKHPRKSKPPPPDYVRRLHALTLSQWSRDTHAYTPSAH